MTWPTISKCPRLHAVECVGKLDVRLILFLTKKGKEGEGKEFKSIPAIAEAHRCSSMYSSSNLL